MKMKKHITNKDIVFYNVCSYNATNNQNSNATFVVTELDVDTLYKCTQL